MSSARIADIVAAASDAIVTCNHRGALGTGRAGWPCLLASASLHCAADAGRLSAPLMNLLTNAIKHILPEGWARIEVTHEPDEVAIAVRDNSFGLNAQQRQHLFEPFHRLGRHRAAAAGAGLGLMFTRQLAEAMK